MTETSGLEPLRGTAAGTVVAFGDDGWGVVRVNSGHELAFHCTAITDGSRTIDVGTEVNLRVVPGRRGRWEATDLRPR